ncbi:unnamed protein product [Menidia menidia]|uniref:(Atlantic silverside) hypothetical protein n=1 Tax=Menidia menidia TaxID=238744 RepID=A0A8S4B1B5_9TELE|nr:unnamed protein product [Menidia menidia]
MTNAFILKMTQKSFILALGIIPFCIEQILGCSLKNVSCNKIKTSAGFTFEHDCPEGSTIFISDENETMIGYADSSSSNHSSEIVNMDNSSVTTKSCQNLLVECLLHSKTLSEICLDFKAITVIAAMITVTTVTTVIIIAGACLFYWKKKLKKQNPLTCPCVLYSCGNYRDPPGCVENYAEQNNTQDSGDMTTPNIVPSDQNAINREVESRLDVDHTDEDREPEGQPLLPEQRATGQHFEMTEKATASVNEHCSGQDQVRKSSAAHTDVESTSKDNLVVIVTQ